MSGTANRVPLEDGLFTWPSEEPQLIGSKCPECEDITFPQAYACGNPDCTYSETPESTLLSMTGTLYSYTIHNMELKDPYEYHSVPYAIGTIELPEGVNVVSKLTTTDDEVLEIGMDVELTVDTLYEEDGTAYQTFFFEPAEEA